MKVLSVNAGSSSLKFSLIELPEKRIIVSGIFERIGLKNSFYIINYNNEKISRAKELDNHKEAAEILLKEFLELNIINSYDEIEGIGHRVVHGGDKYTESIIIDKDVIETIRELIPLSPLHNPANLLGIETFMEKLSNAKHVAVFDTAFHQTLEKKAYLYPVPYEWYEKYGVRKYGFHGTSHKYISEFMLEFLGYNPKMINCHIGNGVSICAIKDGKSVDISLGFTPLEGVMMGTRSGNIDSGIIPFIMKKENKSIEEVINDLNKKSGVLAVSGFSNDLRDIETAILKKEERSILAMDMYVRRIVNYISMYNTLLDGTEIITFTAGAGEKSSLIREKIVTSLKCLGVELDKNLNDVKSEFKKISTSNSKIDVYVVPSDEEIMIAKDTYNLIN